MKAHLVGKLARDNKTQPSVGVPIVLCIAAVFYTTIFLPFDLDLHRICTVHPTRVTTSPRAFVVRMQQIQRNAHKESP